MLPFTFDTFRSSSPKHALQPMHAFGGSLTRRHQARKLLSLNNTQFPGDHLRRVVSLASRRASSHLGAAENESLAQTTEDLPDLNRWAPQGPSWSTPPSQWLVFSDLHVTSRTLPVCLDVLRRVRDEATARSAGVAFLGDFWHLRGSLPVEPLNALVRLFSSEWDVRTLMLVGNHDQVTLGGLTHALTPLAAAAPDAIHVFDGPAMYAGALWLPYRRNPNEIVAALEAATAIDGSTSCSGSPPLAVFAHVDVQGASLNDVCQARDGLPPNMFPKGIPIYTGHYHKPHTVPGTNIRYVGSPYQVSRSEAGQQKALLVLNNEWAVTEEVPLDLGPRHFNIQMLPNDNIITAAAEDTPSSPAAAGNISDFTSALPSGLRSGDRLRLTLAPDQVKHYNKAIRKLSAQGVSVEVLSMPQEAATPRITAAEDLGPQELFIKYAAMRGMNEGAIQKGSELLSKVVGARGPAPGALPHRQVSLSFTAVEVEGYFSFVEPTRYELGDRGLVVVTGKLENTSSEVSRPADGGAESNGAGKTALVMAPLWGLTGDVDARSELGGGRGLSNADVVNEDSKFARVKVEGSVDGVPFMVERKVVRRGKGGGLRFELDGEDRTMQEIRLTQAEIDGSLATSLLGRAAFYGQSEITALLESSDRAFKEELGKIVDLEVWGEAKNASKTALAAVKSAAAAVSTEVQVKQRYVDQQEVQIKALEAQRDADLAALEEKRARGRARVGELSETLRSTSAELAAALTQATTWLTAHVESKRSEEESSFKETSNGTSTESNGSFDLLERELAEAQEALAAAQRHQGAAQASATSKRRKLEDYLALDDKVRGVSIDISTLETITSPGNTTNITNTSIGSNHIHYHTAGAHQAPTEDTNTAGVLLCDTCLQPLSADQVAATAAVLADEHEEAAVAAAAAEAETAAASRRVAEASRQLAAAKQEQMQLMQAAAAARVEVARVASAVESRIAEGNTVRATAESVLHDASQVLLEQYGENQHSDKSSIYLEIDDDLLPISISGDQLAHKLRYIMQACSAQCFEANAALRDLNSAENEQSPLDDEIKRRQEWLAQESNSLAQLAQQSDDLAMQVDDLKSIDEAFRPTGIVSFVLEGALGALQQSANHNLAQLAPSITLELSASRPRASSSASDSVIEQVEKKVLINIPGSTEVRQRSVKQLSGGERRRVALALALGFTELAARRGRLRCDLLVLDEVMQHLDGEGCARLAALLRGMDQFGTVLVVAQARSFMTRAFDGIDIVVRGSAGSMVLRDTMDA